MGPVFDLSLRQLSGKWRLAIIMLVAAVPVAVVLAFRAAGGAEDRSANDLQDAAKVFLDGMLIAAVLPIVTMTFATASFGNEVEDRTLGYIVLNPVSRWSIVLGKMLAPVAVAGTGAGRQRRGRGASRTRRRRQDGGRRRGRPAGGGRDLLCHLRLGRADEQPTPSASRLFTSSCGRACSRRYSEASGT